MEANTKVRARLKVLGDHLQRSASFSSSSSSSSSSSTSCLLPFPSSSSSSSSSWKAEIDELHARKQLSRLRSEEDTGIKRQREAGKLTVRERIHAFLDPTSSANINSFGYEEGVAFHEFGSIAGKVIYKKEEEEKEGKEERKRSVISSFTPANFVAGRGKVNGRDVIVGADDFTVRGGHADGAIWRKSMYAEQLAREFRIPMVRLVDGSSGGGSVTMILDEGRTYVPPLPGMETMIGLLGEVPVVSAVLGPAVGLGAARATLTHFSVIAQGVGQLFAAGPPVVEAAMYKKVTKDELGGAQIHTTNGSIDNLAVDEKDCFRQLRLFLSYLPSNVWSPPPRTPNNPPSSPSCSSYDSPQRRDEELLSIIPKRRQRPYESRKVISHIFDKESFFEIGGNWGRSLIVGLARLDGFPVGVLASDPTENGGVLSASASEKLKRHVDLCETFHLPIVSLVDMPGFSIGIQAEKLGTIRKGTAAIMALYQASVPYFAVIIRRAFGVAGAAFVDRGGHSSPNVRVAWPSGDWGSLPLEGGVEAAFKRQLSQAQDPNKMREDILNKFEEVRSPFRTAENFGIEEIIDPRDTRPLLCEWVGLVYRNHTLLPNTLKPTTIPVYRP